MNGGRNYLLRFLAIGFLVFLGVNLGLSRLYLHYRYRKGSSEWSRKTEVLEAYLKAGNSLDLLFVGDSTVSCGIMPHEIEPHAFNLAWSGFEPSELTALEKQILALPRRPNRVVLGINPSFLSQNEWRNTFDLPVAPVAADSILNFYADTNSMRPFLFMGGVAAFAARFLKSPDPETREGAGAPEVSRVDPDGLLVVDSAPPPRTHASDEDFKFRSVNFQLIKAFRRDLGARGIQVGWIQMPYASDFEAVLRDGPKASRFTARSRAALREIFGPSIVDLSGTVPDRDFRDLAHLDEEGARLVSRKFREAMPGLAFRP